MAGGRIKHVLKSQQVANHSRFQTGDMYYSGESAASYCMPMRYDDNSRARGIALDTHLYAEINFSGNAKALWVFAM